MAAPSTPSSGGRFPHWRQLMEALLPTPLLPARTLCIKNSSSFDVGAGPACVHAVACSLVALCIQIDLTLYGSHERGATAVASGELEQVAARIGEATDSDMLKSVQYI